MGMRREFLKATESFSYRISVTDDVGNEGWTEQTLGNLPQHAQPDTPTAAAAVSSSALSSGDNIGGLCGIEEEPGVVEILPAPMPPLLVRRPGRLLLDIVVNDKRFRRGEIWCGFVPPPPLDDEERRAIASRPGAMVAVITHLACMHCRKEVDYFLQLNPSDPRPTGVPKSAIPLYQAGEHWSCDCPGDGTALAYMRQGLHDVFRYPQPRRREDLFSNFVPLYESGRIEALLGEYEQLIETTTSEEAVQRFLEEHPVFWAFLSPARILHKPAILTKKKADFGILTTHKVLYLVEIEKPSTQLTNRDDSISAEIMKGANQIKDWELVVSDHRLALLSELGLKEGEVQEIRYLLIGGLARRTNFTGLTKLRRSPLASNTQFYCFDELGSFVHSVAGELKRL
jgi:hypothetical protein